MSTASRLAIVGALVLAIAVTVALRRDHASPQVTRRLRARSLSPGWWTSVPTTASPAKR
jgi:hypothetical protein